MGIDLDAAEDNPREGMSRHCRPKWERRPAADTETGDVRGPSSYDLRRFTGKLNQPNCEVRSGRCMERSNYDSQHVRRFPLFEVVRLRQDSQS